MRDLTSAWSCRAFTHHPVTVCARGPLRRAVRGFSRDRCLRVALPSLCVDESTHGGRTERRVAATGPYEGMIVDWRVVVGRATTRAPGPGLVVDSTFILTITVILVASLAVYFLPTIISQKRHHRESVPIFFLNLLLGWSFVGWVAAFVWSLTSNVKPPVSLEERASRRRATEQELADSRARLAALTDTSAPTSHSKRPPDRD